MQKRGENGAKRRGLRLAGLPKWSPQLAWAVGAAVLLLAVFVISLVPPQIRLSVGDVSPVEVKAPQEVIDDAATQVVKDELAKSVPKTYNNDPKVLSDIKTLIASFRAKVTEIAPASVSSQEILQSMKPFLADDAADTDIIATVAANPQVLDSACAKLDQAVSSALDVGLSPENLDNARAEARTTISEDKSIPGQVARVLESFVSKNLKPNLTFNQEETDKRIREALAQVEPVRIRRGQTIVSRGDVVTANQMAILSKLGMVGSRLRFPAIAGSLAMAVAICGLLVTYLWAFHPAALSPGKAGLIASVFMLCVLAVKGMSAVSPFLVPTAGGVMLAATLFDRKFGAFFGACLTLAAATVTGFDVKLIVLSLTGSMAAALAIQPDWNRAHLLRAGLIVSGVHALTYLALGLVGAIPLSDILAWQDTLLVLANGPISAILAVGSLPLFEAAFGILTPLRLIELSNPESPLLHRLLLEAPGTYHHSIMVGNLAEAAAMAIGADSLLARVGAYYHDVGKIKRPYFFSENQVAGMDNPHDKMSPTLSATVITSHVKDGIELSEENKVPVVLRDFIAEHHGTMLASFFYSKASEKETKDNRGPDEWDFRYEGPRPGTKEVAVVMLADGVEAATRALSKPTPARIESVVRKIIQERLMDHQLDRSELTLRELDAIAETFTRVLSGVFHTRIEYPEKAPRQAL